MAPNARWAAVRGVVFTGVIIHHLRQSVHCGFFGSSGLQSLSLKETGPGHFSGHRTARPSEAHPEQAETFRSRGWHIHNARLGMHGWKYISLGSIIPVPGSQSRHRRSG
ncbi:hypothetical protein BZL55_08170, partial [Helicobacter pylori]